MGTLPATGVGFMSPTTAGRGFSYNPGAGRRITMAGGSFMTGNWGWWPGPVYGGYRPIWAPAYVSFLGFLVAGGGELGSASAIDIPEKKAGSQQSAAVIDKTAHCSMVCRSVCCRVTT